MRETKIYEVKERERVSQRDIKRMSDRERKILREGKGKREGM